MFSWLLINFYKINMIVYKYILFFYYYITSYNDIKLFKNNKKMYIITNLTIKNDDQIIFKIKNKKYCVLKKDYNEIIDIVNDIYNYESKISINRILIIKDVKYDCKINYTNDDILKYILMYYGPNNDLYNDLFKIKLIDIKDDQNVNLLIRKIQYVNNNFEEIVLSGNDYLR
jgi:hypothetical protein